MQETPEPGENADQLDPRVAGEVANPRVVPMGEVRHHAENVSLGPPRPNEPGYEQRRVTENGLARNALSDEHVPRVRPAYSRFGSARTRLFSDIKPAPKTCVRRPAYCSVLPMSK